MTETKNAIIKSVDINVHNGIMLTCWVHLDYGGTGQGFGGVCLWHGHKPGDVTGSFLWKIMYAAGVESIGDMAGKPVRVVADDTKVHKIGHFLYDDRWFSAEEMKP